MGNGLAQADHHEVPPLPHAKSQQDTCSVSCGVASLVVAPWPLMETGLRDAPPQASGYGFAITIASIGQGW